MEATDIVKVMQIVAGDALIIGLVFSLLLAAIGLMPK